MQTMEIATKKTQIFELFHFHFNKTKNLKLVLMLVFSSFILFSGKIVHFPFKFILFTMLKIVMTMTGPCWNVCHLVIEQLSNIGLE